MNKNEKSQLTNDEMYLLLLRMQEKVIQIARDGYRIEEQDKNNNEENHDK